MSGPRSAASTNEARTLRPYFFAVINATAFAAGFDGRGKKMRRGDAPAASAASGHARSWTALAVCTYNSCRAFGIQRVA